MGAVHVGISRDFRVNAGLLEKQQLPLCLVNDLTPEMYWEGRRGSTEDTKQTILPGLDGSLRQVAAMVVWGDKLESHVSVTNFCAVGIRDFVIQNLVFWDDALKFHSSECSLTG